MNAINTLRLPPVILLSFCFNLRIHSQSRSSRERYWTGGYNFSILGVSPNTSQSSNGMWMHRSTGFVTVTDWVNYNKVLSATTSFGLNGGILWKDKKSSNFSAIVGEFQQNRQSYIFDHPYKYKMTIPPQDHDADDAPVKTNGEVVEYDKYFKYSISLQRFWFSESYSILRGESFIFLKASFGQTFYNRGKNGMINQNDKEEIKDNDGNILRTTITNYNPKSYMAGIEVGTRAFSPDKDRAFDIGIAWYMPFTSTYTKQYEFSRPLPAVKNQPVAYEVVSKSEKTFGYGSIFLNMTYSFNSKMKERERDTIRIRKKIESQILAHNQVMNGRDFNVQDKVEVGGSELTIKIWDKGLVDGDRVSLYLNGKEIMHDHKLKKRKKEITLHLQPGKNYFVLHALNLGKIPPNTAAVEVEDGYKTREIILNSDMKKSGALEITYTPN
ncbi:MAG: hypothetical protein ACXVNQ_07750 [Bacteroidia bacterium]